MKLMVLGIASKETIQSISSGLTRNFDPDRSLVLFCSFADFEIPLNTEFHFLRNSSDLEIKLKCKLIDVTQQFGKSYDSVPRGHKTISRFDFNSGLAQVKEILPLIDSWDDLTGKWILSV